MKLYELDIDGETSEVYCNSVVSVPAHMRASLKFKQEKTNKFHFNDELQIVTGVVIAVDEPIYRFDAETNTEFQVVFTKRVADKILLDYMKKGYANKLNLEHNENDVLKSAYLFESYQIDSSRGNSVPDAFKDQNLKDGSIIFSYKVEDKAEWEAVKNTGGFSIEGVFELIEVQTNKNQKMSLLKRLGLEKEEPKMTLENFQESKENFAQAETTEGLVVVWDGELVEGTEVFVEVEGVLTPAEGTHTLSGEMDGVVVTIEEGVVASIEMGNDNEEEEEQMAKESEVAEAFEAMNAKFEQNLEAAKAELKAEFEAQLQAKDEQIEQLKADFAAVKKIAPAPTKEKFAGKRKEGKAADPKDLKAEIMKNIVNKK